MSNSAANLYDLINIAQNDINNIAAVEYPAAGLTLTRSSTLAIVTTGTQITWQVETRNYAYTWATTDITIPSPGYYAIHVSIATVLNTPLAIRLLYGSVNSQVSYNPAPTNTSNGFMSSASFGAYFNTGNTFTIAVTPGANTTINVNGETGAAPSPFLHVVQLTGSIE
jgi:hypothetical protein